MRIFVVTALAVAAACGGGGSAPAPSAAYRFLAANPELVVRIDLVKARAWPLYGKALPIATRDATKLLDAAKQQCSLDVMAEATQLVVARRGGLLGGDLALIVKGLPKAKVTSCLTTVANAGSVVKPTIDGDLVHVSLAGRSIASGAFLPGGEIVLVSRGGAGVEPAAWKAEVARAGAPPTWAAELHPSDPIAIRSVNDQRTVFASVQLGDPLVVRGKLTASTAEAAQQDTARARAILTYLEQAGAGTGRIEPQGAIVHADFTATGKQADSFVDIVLPTLVGATPETTPPAADAASEVNDANAPPGDCSKLGPAVEAYIKTNLDMMKPGRRQQFEAEMARLLPPMKQAYVDSCTADTWSSTAVECHVQHATDLPRFERCRLMLPEAKRGRFDKALAKVLEQPGPASGMGSGT